MLKTKLKRNKVNMWVDPEFKKLLKTEAAQNEKNILDFTREIAEKKRIKRNAEPEEFNFFI